jgi:hypothetical protein
MKKWWAIHRQGIEEKLFGIGQYEHVIMIGPKREGVHT